MVIVSSTRPTSAAAVSNAPFIQCALIFGQSLRAAAQHGAVVGCRGIDPCHRHLADVVDLGRSGPEGQSDDVVTIAHDDVVGNRSHRDQANSGHVVLSGIERDQLLTVDDIRLGRAEPCQQSRRTDVVDPRDRGEHAAEFLGYQRQIDECGAVTSTGFG